MKTMENNEEHISSDRLNLTILTILLVLTTLSVVAINFHLGSLTVALALLLATVKGGLVMAYFMHVKFENLLLKILVICVLTFYVSIVLVTFIDYSYR